MQIACPCAMGLLPEKKAQPSLNNNNLLKRSISCLSKSLLFTSVTIFGQVNHDINIVFANILQDVVKF